MLEHFNPTHGAHKGVADTALKTGTPATWVDVAQDCIIIEDDCGTERGLTMRAVVDGGEVIEPLPNVSWAARAGRHRRIVVRRACPPGPGIEVLCIRSVLTCHT